MTIADPLPTSEPAPAGSAVGSREPEPGDGWQAGGSPIGLGWPSEQVTNGHAFPPQARPARGRRRSMTADRLRRGLWRAVLRVRLRLVDRRTYASVALERLGGLPIVVLPDVFNPKLLRSGAFLVEQLGRPDLLPPGSRVLDLGSGSGAAGVAAARRGCRVVATDINPSAVRCTRLNALLNEVDIDVRQGDLFAPLADERFDVVLFNPPYYRGAPRDMVDHAWRSPDVIERFSAELADHLIGHALVVLSSDGEQAAFLGALHRHGLRTRVVAERDLINEILRVYQVQRVPSTC